MSRCPLTYEALPDGRRYSESGLRALSRSLTQLEDFNYSAAQQRQEAIARAAKMSIQGVQPKVSVKLAVSKGKFDIVDRNGTYIVKPQVTTYEHVPENEDLTMKLAKVAGIETPWHGLIRCADGSLSYVIKRFDRYGKNKRRRVEDFAQLSGKSRDTKYDSSLENLAHMIDRYCTFPAIEKVKLFRMTLFSFTVGNEDAHLKNYSVIERDGKIELSPAYDLLNSTVIIPNPQEESALPLSGRKRRLSRELFFDYWAKERLRLSNAVVDDVVSDLKKIRSSSFIDRSFLPDETRARYLAVLAERFLRLGI